VSKNYRGKLGRLARAEFLRRAFAGRRRAPCAICGAPLHVDEATVDHVLASALGGSNAFANLQLACARCASRKSALEAGICNRRSKGHRVEVDPAKLVAILRRDVARSA